MSKESDIREFCGDYAIDIEYSKDYAFTMFFNSRRNAETVKRCIEVDDSVPNAATAVDFVEVVRCKDCGMSRETEEEEYLFCMQFKDTVDRHAFCSYGKRIEDRTHGTQRGQAQKTTDQTSIWEKNMEFLRAGGFGPLYGEESQATLLRYWTAQEQAGYPGASENVKYFAALTKGGTTLEKETH